MKRYEMYNETFKEAHNVQRTAEEQAIGMLVATILEKQGATIRDNDKKIDDYVLLFRNYLEWLNEEV